MSLCRSCREEPAPTHRGVHLCEGCTEVLLRQLERPFHGDGKVIVGTDFGNACKICGEYQRRRIVQHPSWGRICEVDIREAAELYGASS